MKRSLIFCKKIKQSNPELQIFQSWCFFVFDINDKDDSTVNRGGITINQGDITVNQDGLTINLGAVTIIRIEVYQILIKGFG